MLPAVLTSVSFCLHSQGNSAEDPSGVTSEGNRLPYLPTLPLKLIVLSLPSSSLQAYSFSLEFDKFLEERAKAADRLPNLASPSAEGPPGPSPGTAPRKKTQEKDDDMLFAL